MLKSSKPKILIICDYYLPGYKSGGGMRTIVNMVDRLHHLFDFFVITRDHDGKLDRKQYTTVKIDDWNNIGNSKVFYLSKKSVKPSKLRELIKEVAPDLLYFNSFFSTLTIYVLKLRKLRLIIRYPVVLAPCGELSEGALQLKSKKKRFFIGVSRLSGIYEEIIWKASSELEVSEIERVKGKGGQILIAADLPPRIINPEYDFKIKPPKKKGAVKMIFLSRFMRKKNFRWLLENLKGIEGELTIDIYGPLEDADYWEECRQIIDNLPDNIRIQAKGSVPHERVSEILPKYHFFILPTLGENFGHVFLESLAAGCPLVISDRTPWLGLEEKGIGWDLSLEKPEKWVETLNFCINLDTLNYSKRSQFARNYVLEWLADKKHEENTLTVLSESLSGHLSESL